MINWRDIRCFSDLNTFTREFEAATAEKRAEICAEMLITVHEFKMKESQTDLFSAQVEQKVAPRRKRRPRAR